MSLCHYYHRYHYYYSKLQSLYPTPHMGLFTGIHFFRAPFVSCIGVFMPVIYYTIIILVIVFVSCHINTFSPIAHPRFCLTPKSCRIFLSRRSIESAPVLFWGIQSLNGGPYFWICHTFIPYTTTIGAKPAKPDLRGYRR